ncbi:MAG TPA: hypothetical protein PLN93_02410 [Vicinamibacterales bacterium]|nr:hypothetical protein [Vicinamibacterales bacterium]HOQ59588.1 hypothetical protein [Vicinamibacterales bacterium]HPK70769.1 hypothetical protein [Vicinamibacterales bacterium]
MLDNKKIVAGLAVLAVVVAAAAFWMLRQGGGAVPIDLVAQLDDAQKQTTWAEPGDAPFTVSDVTLQGETHRAIFAPPFSRIRWKVEVPRRGTLELYFGMREDAWEAEGNGAQFRVGVSDGRTYEEYLKEVVNPQARERDRRWLSASIDLSAYEGQLVEINLNTDPGPPRDDRDRRNDFALWGEPRLVGR